MGTYISVNNNSVNWRSTTRNRWGITYLRDDNFGYAGNMSYGDYFQLDENSTIRIKTKLGEATDNQSYDDTESKNNLNLYCNLEINFISSDDELVSF